MKLKMIAALALSLAVSLMPRAAMAHDGHHHAAKVKKIKKAKAYRCGAVEFVVRQRIV